MTSSLSDVLYVHVPFCDAICGYCDFCRVRRQDSLVDQWLDELSLEIQTRIKNREFESVYIGGGTPSCLNVAQLKRLFQLLFLVSRNCKEYTIEVNPETINLEKVQLMKTFGINRVSLGVQSVDENLLKEMNRRHTVKEIEQALTWFKSEGIDNISVDCMYSLPNQTIKQVLDTLKQCVLWNVPHISIYSLTIEPGSQFFRDGKKSQDEELEADMYEKIIEFLKGKGYHRYEISNFAKDGFESIHNKHYWQYDDFIGLSIGASGKENGTRYTNTSNFQTYFQHQYQAETILLSPQEQIFEALMMGLRMKQGIHISQFNQRFHCDLKKDYQEAIKIAENNGWIEKNEDYLCCTEKGLNVCNSVIELFMT